MGHGAYRQPRERERSSSLSCKERLDIRGNAERLDGKLDLSVVLMQSALRPYWMASKPHGAHTYEYHYASIHSTCPVHRLTSFPEYLPLLEHITHTIVSNLSNKTTLGKMKCDSSREVIQIQVVCNICLTEESNQSYRPTCNNHLLFKTIFSTLKGFCSMCNTRSKVIICDFVNGKFHIQLNLS